MVTDFENLISSVPSKEQGASIFPIKYISTLRRLKKTQLVQTRVHRIHLISSFLSSVIFILLFILSLPQVIVFKSFLIEFVYNLNDTCKSFFLILVTDLIVGFHSSKAWELVLSFVFNSCQLLLDKDLIYLIISIFPVFLDTLFKYWIFRYLNKISPSTVATYQNMIE